MIQVRPRFDLKFKLEGGDLVQRRKLKRTGLDYFLAIFIWCGTVFAWLVFSAILHNLIENETLALLAAIVCAFLLRILVNEAIAKEQRKAAELLAERSKEINILIDSVGIKYVEGRTITSYGWEDFIDAKNHGIAIELQERGGGELFLPVRIFGSREQLDECFEFSCRAIAGTEIATA